MSFRARLFLGFVVILSLFLLNLAIHRWSGQRRDESFETLREAIGRQALTSSLRQRTGDMQKEMALLSDVYTGANTGGPAPEELGRFRAQIEALDRDLRELEARTSPEDAARVQRFTAACRDLAWSWQTAFQSFGVDNARSITELSLRADPLSQRVSRDLLPDVEKAEALRVQTARDGFYGAVRFADRVTDLLFGLSALVALVVAVSLSRYLVSLNRVQEERVKERTRELQAYVERLRDSESRYALAAQGSNDGLWDWDIAAKTVYYSPRWLTMIGLTEKDAQENGTPSLWLTRVHPEDRERLGMAIVAHIEGLSPHFEHEHRIEYAGGKYRWFVARGLAVRNEDGQAFRMAGSLTDVTPRKLTEAALLHDALHDALTGLPNRTLFMDRLGVALARTRAGAQRGREPHFAVVFLDLDRFKVVNDGLGHAVGDALLVEVGRRLAACVRPGDTVARMGGDEFTLLLEDLGDVEHGRVVAQRVQEAVDQPCTLGGQDVFTTVSAGFVFGSASYARPEEVLQDADTALYRAKSLGKARCVFFDNSMRERAVEVLELETNLRRAVEREELRLHYQPIVDLATGAVEGFEALVRWEHPKRGLLAAGAFLDVAEDTGLIIAIGRWVVREACRQIAAWDVAAAATGHLPSVSVNVSGRQFTQAGLVDDVRAALDQSGLAPSRLRLEITESAIMENTEAARTTLAQLRALGIALHMDDFGTGYSSMRYLRDFQIDALKIDQSFVGHMGPNGENTEIVRTIIDLGHGLGLTVIAEGIEKAQQAEQLRAFGCEHGQGFFYSRPLDAAAVEAFLASAAR
jgi:diguanylate cyclase (GGDEF)-like protein/PAS domain S-box-containing protein